MLNIHANGGYDVVSVDEDGEEGEYVEFVGFSLDPLSLDQITSKFVEQGAIIVDHRSQEKRDLAAEAKRAVETARDLILYAASNPGVEREAVGKARDYANLCVRRATEASC